MVLRCVRKYDRSRHTWSNKLFYPGWATNTFTIEECDLFLQEQIGETADDVMSRISAQKWLFVWC